ncbi:MAG: oligosaccharide flippase family protein [Caldithrix sp.]|nr:oligosaccharide flippase family protein [Caldithrix sp.]
MLQKIKNISRAPTARKTAALYTGIMLNVALGYVVTKLNTAWLSVEQFGMFSLFINTLFFMRAFLSFGLFEAASRLLAVEPEVSHTRRYLAATLTLTLFLGLLLSLSILILSRFFDAVFETRIGFLLWTFWPLAVVVMLQGMLQITLRGLSYIRLLSVYMFLPRLLYVLLMAALMAAGLFTLKSTLLTFLLTLLVVSLWLIYRLQPQFTEWKSYIGRLLQEVREFGAHLYLANILTAFIYHSDKLILAYFIDARQLAYYALAFALTMPITHFSKALSTSAYKNFANQTRLDRRFLLTNFAYIAAAASGIILLRHFIITDLFSAEFLPSIPPLIVLAIAFAFSGLSVPYTMFFKAQKRGREVRNITFTVQLVFVAGNLILIPWFGIMGAAWATLIAFVLDYGLYVIQYRLKY